MMSLYPIDPASVEVEPRTLDMTVGESAYLTASVIPEWADDVSVVWYSSDEAVAVVNSDGCVTATGQGECRIIAESVNGRSDECSVTVK